MNYNVLIKQYMNYKNLILASIDLKKEKIFMFDGENNKEFTYEEFFTYLPKFFNFEANIVEKGINAISNIKTMEGNVLTIDSEYKNNKGNNVLVQYSFLKYSSDVVNLSVRKLSKERKESVDEMTKANLISFIDNRAKNNMLIKQPFVLVYVDIDNFKQINDEYGQVIGDMILIELVSNCKNIIGNNGAIARVGGDRFLIIYNIEDDYNTVHNFLFDLKINMQKIVACTSRGISITLTMGSAQYPSDGPYELLLKKCEKALIRGKNKGRDCFIMYLVEKCGPVSINDVIDDKIVKIDNVSAKNDVYSVISNINQTLSDVKQIDVSLEKALSLVGSYFYLDRVSIARLDILTGKIKSHNAWYNPKTSIKIPAYCVDEITPIWGECLGQKNYIKIDDITVMPDAYPLKELFKVDSTTASISFELVVNNKSFGLIRFDMTTGARHWQPEDFQVFMLISQIFTSYIQKNYLIETNFKTLYSDPKYGCNNFTYFFKTVGEEIISGNIDKIALLEFDIRNIINLRTIIGDNRMLELIKVIQNVLDKNNILYGKQHDGPFILCINSQDKNEIDRIYDELNLALSEFTKKNSLNELSLQAGVYLADTKTERLITAIGNANLTRNINKTTNLLYYSEDVKNAGIFKTEMILRIDEALNNKEFLLYLQPKISTTDGSLVGAEALTRWKYKGEKLLFPDTFIPLFEEQGVIEKLDYAVFENVCIYQEKLIKAGKKPVPISVNVSRYVSNFDGYIEKIEFIRKKYNIDPSLIEVEITEGMYYENSYMISEFISKLHNAGYNVSMDDFGAGYSNLVSMAKLKFDVIKFDKSFCMDLQNENVRIMLDKLIELIKMMNMKTLCEGVETKENVEYLTSIGVDSIQGYYYSKPIPAAEFYEKYYMNK